LLEQTLRAVASRHGYGFHRRAFGDTQSFELVRIGTRSSPCRWHSGRLRWMRHCKAPGHRC
jgi:hypothetical protein